MPSIQRLLFVFLGVVGVVGVVLGCPKTVPVKCPEVTVVPDFDVVQYFGRWYEIERAPQEFQPNGACVTAQYGPQSGNPLYPVRVINRQLNEGTGVYHFIDGNVRLSEPTSTEGKLKVIFPGITPDESDYWVLATDYTKFALVYSCRALPDNTIYQSAWVLGRSRELSIDTKRAVDAAFQSSGVDRSILTKTRQDSTCVYDEISPRA